MKKLMVFIVLMVASMASNAWDGVYKQVPVNPQEMRTVNGHTYSGRNPTASMFWVVQHFGDTVAMEQLALSGDESGPHYPTGTNWGAFTGVPVGKWIDNFDMVISDGSRHAQAILEEESPTELTMYMYWCTPASETVDTYTRWRPWDRRNWMNLYTKSSKDVEIGCYVPSRQYIKLEKIN